MKKCFILLLYVSCSAYGAVVTNACDAGYTGDTLINYIKAKYIAHKYNIPFELNPHKYLEPFVLFDVEPHLQPRAQMIKVDRESQMHSIQPHAVYSVSYYCHVDEWSDNRDIRTWDSALNDVAFRNEIRRAVFPKKEMSFSLPTDAIVVGVHIRKPLKPDGPYLKSCQFYNTQNLVKRIQRTSYSDTGFPFKFLPDQYYIDQIRRIINMYPHDKILVYLYNNDPDSEKLCVAYQREINCDRLSIIDPYGGIKIPIYPAAGWASYAAEDLVALSKFDYLIRGKSNYSQVSDFIGDHKMVIAPKNAGWYVNEKGQDCLVVESVEIKTKQGNGSHRTTIVPNL